MFVIQHTYPGGLILSKDTSLVDFVRKNMRASKQTRLDQGRHEIKLKDNSDFKHFVVVGEGGQISYEFEPVSPGASAETEGGPPGKFSEMIKPLKDGQVLALGKEDEIGGEKLQRIFVAIEVSSDWTKV
jgi:hypothetical protein